MKIFRLIALAVVGLMLAVAANAAQYDRLSQVGTTSLNAGTNQVALTATNGYSTQGLITVPNGEHVFISLKYNFHAAPVGALPTVIARFQRSADGSAWESATNIVFTIQPAPTNSHTFVTNLNTTFPYIRLVQIENTNSTAITNVSLVYTYRK